MEFDREHFFELFMNPEVPLLYKATFVIFVGLYFISPIDIIPDYLLGFVGFADDFGILIGGASVFTWASNKYLEEKHEDEQDPQLAADPYNRQLAQQYEAATPQQRVNDPDDQQGTLPMFSPRSKDIDEAMKTQPDPQTAPAQSGPTYAPSATPPPQNPPPVRAQSAESQPEPPAPPPLPQTKDQVVIAPPADAEVDTPPKPRKGQPVVPAEGIDYTQDEWHERLVRERRKKNDRDFDEITNQRQQNQSGDDWDFARNDPIEQRRRKRDQQDDSS